MSRKFDLRSKVPATYERAAIADIVGGVCNQVNLVAEFSPITNAISGDVSLNNTGSFFDGPSINQGTTGVWLVMGKVTLTDSAGAAVFIVKLHDGTTVIDSTSPVPQVANDRIAVSLCGFITNPAGNLRISVKDASSTSGKIVASASGLSFDSTITAIRIG